jgi:hypothetical protein
MAAVKKKSAFEEAANFFNTNIAQPIQRFAQPAVNNVFHAGQNLANDYQKFSNNYNAQVQRNQQAAAGFARDFANNISKTTTNAVNYFNPASGYNAKTGQMNNLWGNTPKPVQNFFTGAQNAAETGKLFPQFKVTSPTFEKQHPWVSAGANLAANVIPQTVNSVVGQGLFAPGRDIGHMLQGPVQYKDLHSGPAKLFYQAQAVTDPRFAQSAGVTMKPQEFLANVGQAATPAIDAYLGAGLPKTFINAFAKQGGKGILSNLLRGGVENIVPGAAGGVAAGLEGGRDANSVGEQLQKAGQYGAVGAGTGFGLGAALGGVGRGLSSLGNAFVQKYGSAAEAVLLHKELIQKNILGIATAQEKEQYAILNQNGALDTFVREAFPDYVQQDGSINPAFADPKTSPLEQLLQAPDAARYRVDPNKQPYAKNTTKYNMQMNLDDLQAGQSAIDLIRHATKNNDLNAMVSGDYFAAQDTLQYLAEKYVKKGFGSKPLENIVDELQNRIDVDSGAIDPNIVHPGFENNMLGKIENVSQNTPIGPESTFTIKNLGEAFRTAPGGEFDMTKMEGVRALASLFNDKEIQFMTSGKGDIVTPDGKIAQGSQYKNLIKVVQENGHIESKTLYHEAFHAFSRNFADQHLYNEALKEALGMGAKDAAGAEEFLAEGFADFMSQKQTFTGRIQQFFQAMYEQVRSLMGRENSINTLYHDMLTKKRPEGIAVRSGAEAYRVGNLPRNLVKAKPRFGNTVLQFESQIDKALYIVGNLNKKSKSDADYMTYLHTEFPELSDYNIRTLGQQVKEQIKAYGPGDIDVLDIPDTGISDTQSQTPTHPIAQEVPSTKPNAPADIINMITEAAGTDDNTARALYESYAEEYTFPASFEGLRTLDAVGLSGEHVAGVSEEEIATQEQQVIQEIQQEMAGAADLPKRGRIPVGQKKTRAYFSDIPPKAVQDALNNPNSALRNAIRKNITEKIKNGGGIPQDPVDRSKELKGFVKTVRESLLTEPEVAARVEGNKDAIGIEAQMNAGKAYLEETGADIVSKEVFDPNSPFDSNYSARAMALAEKWQGEGKWTEASDVLNELALRMEQAGQGTVMAKYWARMTPTGMLKWAEDTIAKAKENLGIVGKFIKKEKVALTDEDRQFITTRMQDINKMAEGPEKDKAVMEVLERINKRIPITASEVFEAYRYQNLLSNPRTHEKNIYSNLWETIIAHPAELGIEGAFDFAQSMVNPTRERTAHMRDLFRYEYNMAKSFNEARTAARDVLKGTKPIRNPDIKSIRSKRLPKALTMVTRFLEAQDQFFWNLAYGGQLSVELSRGIAPDVAAKRAEETASSLLFRAPLDPRNKSGQGFLLSGMDAFAQGIKTFANYNVLTKPVRWVVPFIDTINNIVKRNIERNPALTGPIALIGANNKRQKLARMTYGGIMMGVGTTFAMQGKTTWGIPKDEEERKLFFAAKRKPYSVNINGIDVPLAYFGAGTILAMGIPAAVQYYYKDSPTALTDTDAEKIGNIIAGSLNLLSQQSYLSGVGGIVRTLQGDVDFKGLAGFAKNVGYISGQVIPANGLLGYIAKIMDPTYRKTEGFFDQFLQNIPGYSKGLKPYEELVGGESTRLDNPLASDYTMPWTLGGVNPEFNQMLGGRQKELQNNAITNKLKRDVENGVESGPIAVGAPGVAGASTTDPKQLKELNKKSNELFDLYFKTDSDGMKQQIQAQIEHLGVNFETALEHYVNKDTELKLQGLSPAAQEKMQDSTNFQYVRKLRDTYGPLLADQSFVQKAMQDKGITQEELAYDDKTALPEDVQVDEVKAQVDGLSGNELLTKLMTLRVKSRGTRQMLLTDSIVGKLQKEDLLTKDEAKMLKRVQWDEKEQTFKMDEDKSGGGKRPKINVAHPTPVKAKRVSVKLGGGGKAITPLKPVKIGRANIGKPGTGRVKFTQGKYQPARIQYRGRQGVHNLAGLGGTS